MFNRRVAAAIVTDPKSGNFFGAGEQNNARSLVLYATGALLGLGIAGYGLFTAAGTSTRSIPPEDIAMVNQRPILRSDFINQIESETAARFSQTTPADRSKVLGEMIREELLVQRGLELDFAETDQSTRNALVTAVTQQASVQVTTSEPTEAQLRTFYDAHKENYTSDGTMLVRNLFLPKSDSPDTRAAEALIGAARAALQSGAPVEQVIARFAMSEAQRYDEDYYFAAKYRLGDTLFSRVKDLNDGEVSNPVVLPDGIHLVLMIRNHKPQPLGFDASHAQVFSDYKTYAETAILESTLAFLRKRAKIVIADDSAALYHAGQPLP
jgi:parvulin-like peptidyl-prolyl isomerase